MNSKKAQAWGFDLMIALSIFMTGVVTFWLFSMNSYDESSDIIKSLSYEGQVVSDSILSEGDPSDWTADNVVRIGVLSSNSINDTKLEQFYSLSLNDYQKTKNLLNTNDEYYFFLSEPMVIDGLQVQGIGMKNSSSNNLIKITRYTIYEDKPVTANLYIWN
jgi:hypothetical protein